MTNPNEKLLNTVTRPVWLSSYKVRGASRQHGSPLAATHLVHDMEPLP